MFHGSLVAPEQRGRRAGLGGQGAERHVAPGPMLIVPSFAGLRPECLINYNAKLATSAWLEGNTNS